MDYPLHWCLSCSLCSGRTQHSPELRQAAWARGRSSTLLAETLAESNRIINMIHFKGSCRRYFNFPLVQSAPPIAFEFKGWDQQHRLYRCSILYPHHEFEVCVGLTLLRFVLFGRVLPRCRAIVGLVLLILPSFRHCALNLLIFPDWFSMSLFNLNFRNSLL